LAPEARLGRVAALRALGRTEQEREAIDDYLDHHPQGLDAERMRRRATVLAETGAHE